MCNCTPKLTVISSVVTGGNLILTVNKPFAAIAQNSCFDLILFKAQVTDSISTPVYLTDGVSVIAAELKNGNIMYGSSLYDYARKHQDCRGATSVRMFYGAAPLHFKACVPMCPSTLPTEQGPLTFATPIVETPATSKK